MREYKWMAWGLALLSLVAGFLVGASATPVAGVAITAIFGVATASFAFLQKLAAERQLDAIEKLSASGANAAEGIASINSLRSDWDARSAAGMTIVGKAVALFAVSFAVGIGIGAWARIANMPELLRSPAPARPLPWLTQKDSPGKTENALTWILIQDQLRRGGYSTEQIRALYEGWRKEIGGVETVLSVPYLTGARASSLEQTTPKMRGLFGLPSIFEPSIGTPPMIANEPFIKGGAKS